MDLKEFEKYLKDSVRKNNISPLTTEEVIKILESYDPPDDLGELQDPKIVRVMVEEYQKRKGET